MKLSTIEFNGYKRFLTASCNVDGQTIAFIGPNEAGKSSVLQGLQWLTDEDHDELESRELNRRQPPTHETYVVRAYFRLDDEDITALKDLNLDVTPEITRRTVTEFRLSRQKDGNYITGIDSQVDRNPKPFNDAIKGLDSVEKARRVAHQSLQENDITGVEDLIEQALTNLNPEEKEWNAGRVAKLREVGVELESLAEQVQSLESPGSRVIRFLQKLESSLPHLQAAADAGARPHPHGAMRGTLRQRAPTFLLFTDDDREMAETYALNDANIQVAPPAPLRNLLKVAGSTVADIWRTMASGDTAAMRTLERRLNETLRSRLQPMWTQSKLTIELTLNQGGVLEVNIQELDSPEFTVTPIAERSDGLRAFLGLVCFLIAADLPTPPVLLIDEAERNLHYDAQADLVRVLTNELRVHKVIYTTHSPGCLPLDLGTGIRVVARNPEDPAVSTLENNFWTGSEAGFSHLLFAMGAQAAAFSAFRRAVLTEGVSDMILLPTLLRNATDGVSLDFQVAYGLSNLPAPQAMGAIALITTFLVDGDASGNTKKKQLVDAGIPRGHIFQLPVGKAIEDLVDRATYLRVVNDFLAETNQEIPAQAIDKSLTIAKAVDKYAQDYLGRPSGVSHKIIASRLAEMREDLPLTAAGKRYLTDLRVKLDAAFSNPYTVGTSET